MIVARFYVLLNEGFNLAPLVRLKYALVSTGISSRTSDFKIFLATSSHLDMYAGTKLIQVVVR
jgi:hypothetical protein